MSTPKLSPSFMDPHLSRLVISGRFDYSNWVMTAQLKCFVGSVRFITVFACSSAGIQLFEHTRVPMSADK